MRISTAGKSEKIIRIKHFNLETPRKTTLSFTVLIRGFQGTVVNRTLPSLHRGSCSQSLKPCEKNSEKVTLMIHSGILYRTSRLIFINDRGFSKYIRASQLLQNTTTLKWTKFSVVKSNIFLKEISYN